MLKHPELAKMKVISALGLKTAWEEILLLESLRSGVLGGVMVMEGWGAARGMGQRQVVADIGRSQLKGSCISQRNRTLIYLL